MEKGVAEKAHYTQWAKKLDVTRATGNNSNIFLSAYKTYGINQIDSLAIGQFRKEVEDLDFWKVIIS